MNFILAKLKVNRNLNGRLKQVRVLLNLSQKDFSEGLSIKQGSLSDIERGRIGVSPKVAEAVCQKFEVNPVWLHTGEGETFIGKNYNLKGVDTGIDTGDDGIKNRKIAPYDFYKELTEKDLDFELSLEIEELKDVFEDYNKFIKAIHQLNAPDFIKEKFPILEQKRDFQAYKNEIEREFLNDHSHLTDTKRLKILKIIDLYQSNTKHWRSAISQLINYLNRYADFFSDKK